VQAHVANVMEADMHTAAKQRAIEERHLQYLADAGFGPMTALYEDQMKASASIRQNVLLARSVHRAAVNDLRGLKKAVEEKEHSLQILMAQHRDN
jgi:hypothetical protein